MNINKRMLFPVILTTSSISFVSNLVATVVIATIAANLIGFSIVAVVAGLSLKAKCITLIVSSILAVLSQAITITLKKRYWIESFT